MCYCESWIFVQHGKGPGLKSQCICRHRTNPKKGDLQEGRYCWPEFGGQHCWAAWRCPGQARMAAGERGRPSQGAKTHRHEDTQTQRHEDTQTQRHKDKKQALKRRQTNTQDFKHRYNDTRHNTHKHTYRVFFFWFLKVISVCWVLGFKLNWFPPIVDRGKDLGN